MVGQITHPPAQMTSTAVSSSALETTASPPQGGADTAKNTIEQLKTRLQAAVSDNPAAASRIAGEIDNAAREYRAAGGTGPIPGVPAQVSRLRHQSAEDGSDISQRQNGAQLDIKV